MHNVPCLDVEKCAEEGPVKGLGFSGEFCQSCPAWSVWLQDSVLGRSAIEKCQVLRDPIRSAKHCQALHDRKICLGLEPLGKTKRRDVGLHQIHESCS